MSDTELGEVSDCNEICEIPWHIIDSSGIRPDQDKVMAIRKVPVPANVGDVGRFLGMVNQMSKLSPNLAEITQPLKELLIKGNQWVWGEPQRGELLAE